MTDITFITTLVRLWANYPIQIVFIGFFGAYLIGIIRQELSK